jgi:spore coat polysaccharide biosynthesis predicted glycosyltransferase SpsG
MFEKQMIKNNVITQQEIDSISKSVDTLVFDIYKLNVDMEKSPLAD